jgi:hypothetical protein
MSVELAQQFGKTPSKKTAAAPVPLESEIERETTVAE